MGENELDATEIKGHVRPCGVGMGTGGRILRR